MIIIPTEKRFDWRRRPWVLIGLVMMNVLVFFWYQSGDQPKLEQAMESYMPLYELEWPLYERYLEQQGDAEALEDMQQMHKMSPEFSAPQLMLDQDFYRYLHVEVFAQKSYEVASRWSEQRDQVNQQVGRLSFMRWGLIPAEWSVATLFTHQFLHGDTMHLLGNLFFLVLCGFAVEAAIGHWRFLAFYLLSGLAGGLGHMLFEAGSTAPLVGASGAISGVMAMYLGVFMLRKIEFFYWVFIFVGYFRAPALAILPLYIGKEVISYMQDPDAGIAFMAHAGGFILGALLMLANHKFSPAAVDTDYVEETTDEAPENTALGDVFRHIESYQFERALKSANAGLKAQPENFALHLARYNLCKIAGGELLERAAASLLSCPSPNSATAHQQVTVIRKHPEAIRFMQANGMIALLGRLCSEGETQVAEKTYRAASARIADKQQLMLMAKKMAQGFAELGQLPKSKEYQAIAIDLQEVKP